MSESFEASPPAGSTGWVCRPGREFESQQELDEALGTDLTDEPGYLSYEEMPSVAWDGISPLSVYNTGIIFWNLAELTAFCAEAEVELKDLQLVHCEPLPVREIVSAMICPELPELVLPSIIMAGIDRLNRLIAAQGAFGWQPTAVAALIVE
jgi:hypothetical protein